MAFTIDDRASVVDRFRTLRTGESVRREFIIPLELSAEELAALLQPPADSAARAAICQVLRRLVLAAQKEILGSQQWLCFLGALRRPPKRRFLFAKTLFAKGREESKTERMPTGRVERPVATALILRVSNWYCIAGRRCSP